MEEENSSGNTAPVENAVTSPSSAKKAAKPKAKSQRSKSTHPPVADMVTAAIKSLQDRKGSSVQAIKKYMTSTYKVDGEKMTPFIKKYLKSAITAGAVVQTKGKGASGSFKLATSSKGSESKSKAKHSAKKPASAAAEKKPVEKEPASPKKPAFPRKAAAKKPAATTKKPSPKNGATAAVKKVESPKAKEVQPKNPSKAKKAAKAPAAKTKTPKPKTAKSPKLARSSARK